MGVSFEVRISNQEERCESTIPQEMVKELALQKAENVAREYWKKEAGEKGAFPVRILGADTIVVQNGAILGKPKNRTDAVRMIRDLQGSSHFVYTGVALLCYDAAGQKTVQTHVEETRVFVHPMTGDEILEYVNSGECDDKAGAYGIQGSFGKYIHRIEGDYYNVVGLPLSAVYQMLKRNGI